MTRPYDALVVGAGHNGLVCAAYLAKAGLRVLVLERRGAVGGAAVTEELIPGFRFDPCAHRLDTVHPGVVRDLGLADRGVEIRRPEPAVFAPLPDGGQLTVSSDLAETADSIRRFSPADAERWSRFGAAMRPALRFLAHLRAITPPELPPTATGDLLEYMKLGLRLRLLGAREMTEVLRLLPMSAEELIDEWFESEPLRGVLAAIGVTGLFLGPRAAGTAFAMLGGLSDGAGVLRAPGAVVGGIGRLTEALAEAALAHGAEIRTDVEVEAILTGDSGTTGVLVDGKEIPARRVISNADPKRTFLRLLEPAELDPEFVRRVRNIRMRGAFAKVHLALAGPPRFSASNGGDPPRGAIRISPSLDYLERAHDDAKYGEVSREPFLEATIPSLTDSSLAPPGRHAMSVYMQYAPYRLRDGGWSAERASALADLVVETLERYAPGLGTLVLDRRVTSPADLESEYGLTGGCASHGEMALDQLFFMRPVPGWARYRTPIARLYLCGAGTHPGGGVNGAPGHHAAREILSDVKAGA